MTNWNIIRVNGERLIYEYKTSWQKRYYSFDGGETWHLSKREAYEIARINGTLRCPMECHQ